MKRRTVFIGLLSILCTVVLPARGQLLPGSALLRSGKNLSRIVYAPQYLRAAGARLSQAMSSNYGSVTAQVASTHLIDLNMVETFEQHLANTWAARAQRSRLWAPPALTVQEAAHVLLNDTSLTKLSDKQKEAFFSQDYVALILEGPFLPNPAEESQAVAYYTQLLQQTPALAQGEKSVENWATLMGGITNLGLVGTAEHAPLILKTATQPLPPQLVPWTDVITVRALLNLKAYDQVQALADFRLQQSDDTPARLSAGWYALSQYMKQHFHPLDLPPQAVRYDDVFPKLPTDIQTVLGAKNPYNLFNLDERLEVTQNFLQLRENLANKVKQQSNANMVSSSSQLTDRLRQQAAVFQVPPRRDTLPKRTIGYARYENRALWDTDETNGRDALLHRAIQEYKEANLQLLRARYKLDHATEETPQQQLAKDIEQFYNERNAAAARLHQIKTGLEQGQSVDKIFYTVYGYLPVTHSLAYGGQFFTRLTDLEEGLRAGFWNTHFRAPVASQEDEHLKQALLARAEQDIVAAREEVKKVTENASAGRGDLQARVQAKVRLQSALHKFNYVKNEILQGAPYEAIVTTAYGENTELSRPQVWKQPPFPFRFEGDGLYVSFEGPVSSRGEGYDKQEMLNKLMFDLRQAKHRFTQAQKTLKSAGSVSPAQLARLQQEVTQSSAQLVKAEQRLQQTRAFIFQGMPLEDIITYFYGGQAAKFNPSFVFHDAHSSVPYFSARVSNQLDGEIKQAYLDQAAQEYQTATQRLDEAQKQLHQLENIPRFHVWKKKPSPEELRQARNAVGNAMLEELWTKSKYNNLRDLIRCGWPMEKIRSQFNELAPFGIYTELKL